MPEVSDTPQPPQRVSRWRKPLFIVVAMALLLPSILAALLFFGVPYLATSVAPNWVKEKTGRDLRIGEATFNPFTLDLSVQKFSLNDGTNSLARFEALDIDGSWASISNWAFTTNRITLTKPQIDARIDPSGSLDWARFIDALPKSNEPPKDDTSIPRMLLNQIEIVDASGRLTDARVVASGSDGKGQSVSLDAISLKLEKLSTLPRDRGEYSLDATLNDQTRVQWKGRVGLNPIDSSGDLIVSNLPIGKTLRLSGAALPLAIDGMATLRANYSVAAGTDFVAVGVGGGKLDLADVSLRNPAAAAVNSSDDIATLKSIELSPLSFSWVKHNASASQPSQISYALEPFNAALGAISVKAAGADPEAAFASLSGAAIDSVSVNVVEQIISVANVRLDGADVNVSRNTRGEMAVPFASLGATPSQKKQPEAAAATETTAGALPWRINAPDIAMERAKIVLRDASFATPQRAAVNLDLVLGVAVATGVKPTALISSRTVKASELTLRDDTAADTPPWLSVKEIRLPQFSTDVLSAKIELPRIEVLTPQLLASLSKTGLDLAEKLALAASDPPQTKASIAPAAAPAKRVSISGVALSNGRLVLADTTLSSPLSHVFEALAINIDRIELDGSKPIVARATTNVAGGGAIKANATFNPIKRDGNAALNAEKVLLAPFSPYLNQNTRLKLNQGEFSSDVKITFDTAPSAAEPWRVNASATLAGVEIFDEVAQANFATWRELSSNDIAIRTDRQRLEISLGDLLLDEAKTRLIIGADRSVNLAQIAKPNTASASTPSPANPNAAPPPMDADGNRGARVKVARLQVTGGDLEFADLSLRPQFGARISDLSGLVVGLSNEPSSRAEVSLEGKVDQFGLARLSGTLAPLGATEYTKLKAVFRNLEMASLTPYSGKFAGRAIKSGKLTLDLDYNIEQRKLKGENSLLIDNLVLGEKIDSPDATNLPLDLAIALLRDSDGKIDLGLPVQGSLDDPQFSYGSLIWKAIGNVLTKIASAPFRALGALLGGSGEAFEAVIFEPGEARLLPPEREKLGKLSKALEKRPQLKLTIEGRFDTARDREALADNILKLEVSKRAGMKPPAANEPLIISFTDAKVQAALDDMAATVGDEAVKLRAKFLPPAGNAVTGLLQNARERVTEKGRAEAAAARAQYYPELFKLIRSKQVVPEFAYAALAGLRAEAIRNTVVGVNNFDASRVSVAAPQPVAQSKADQVATTLALSVK